MGQRKTINEVKELFLARNLYLDEIEYKNNRTPLKCHDKNGYYYNLTLVTIQDKRISKFEIVNPRNKFSIQNINTYLKSQGVKTVVLSKEYINEKTPLQLKCECGEIFEAHWNHIQSSTKYTCLKCAGKRKAEKRRFDVDFVAENIKKQGYTLLKDTYIDAHHFSIEDEHGYRYPTCYNNIITGKTQFQKFSPHNPFTIHNIINYIDINNLPVRLANNTERTINTKQDMLTWICAECGKEFKSYLYPVLYENRCRCQECSKKQSKCEYLVEEYLKNLNVLYEKEKRFDDCRNIRALPFDFYLPEYNTVIEVHGQQHYYENEMFDQSLKERQRLDSIKKNYCIDHDIKYVEIPFWKISNNHLTKAYKNIIDNILI